MIAVESSEDTVRVSIPRGEVGAEALDAWLDWLRLESIAQNSQLSEVDADVLAEESKAQWWQMNRHRFVMDQS
jgi:hypothetical protein